MTVYYDVFFVINLCMDLLLFISVAKLLRIRVIFRRAFLAALVSAGVSILLCTFAGNTLFSFFIHISAVLLACFICFDKLPALRFGSIYALFLVLEAGLSFALTKLFSLINDNFEVKQASGSGGIIPIALCAISVLLSGIVSRVFSRIKRKRMPKSAIVTVFSGESKTVMSAYCDSGNLLREPMGGLPVIITGAGKMHSIVPPELYGVFFASEKCLGESTLDGARRLRIIPIMPVGTGGARVLFGYVPDRVLVDGREVEVCIALDTGNDSFGGYDSLLPSALIK
ncbi:MAG: hypothetical protein E7626_01155 [Ruminococcaceae bacterium]|nr:hypothetical protein [Oscillospiraceae bacterium]